MSRLVDVEVFSPKSVEEALEILTREGERAKVVAGGTDLIIQMKEGVIRRKKLIDIFNLDELRYIKLDDNVIRIGALTSFSEIARSPIIRKYAKILAEASKTVGSMQIMNKASIGGNIVNASPAADGVPPLYVLDAELVIRSKNGERVVPVEKFYLGYKKLDLRPDELLVEIRVRPMGESEDGIFLKHGPRLGDIISVVNMAILVKWSGDNVIEDAKIALGAVAPTIVRARSCEEYLAGKRPSEENILAAAGLVVRDISPIDDIRGTAEYRRELAINMLYMGLWELASRRGALA